MCVCVSNLLSRLAAGRLQGWSKVEVGEKRERAGDEASEKREAH